MQASAIYNDFQGLAALRHEARSGSADGVEQVAAQFESLFLQMMLKSMRDATIDGGLFESNQLDTYQQMFDQQVSLDLSQRGGLGLAKTLVQQLQANSASASPEQHDEAAAATGVPGFDLESLRRAQPAVDRPTTAANSAVGSIGARPEVASAAATPAAETQAENWAPATPAEFIAAIREPAQRAARELGVDAGVLVAQAALETGWGRKLVQRADGGSSLNLFNIKAGAGWGGERAVVGTVEFVDGLPEYQKAAFRAYDSVEESFADYVKLLKNSERYQPAMDRAADPAAFLGELQNAGYATDPRYAAKVLAILEQGGYRDQLAALKNSPELPLNG